MANIIWQSFGGLSDSLWSGIKNSFYKIIGINIHDNPGSITVNQKLTKDSGTTITALCRVSLALSDGSKLWFSYTDGKIWRESSGTYTLVYTTSPSAGNAGCLGAAEYNSYIYWATQSRLHRIAIASIATAQNWTDNAAPNWQTFTKTDSEFHPMFVQTASLFIGDGNLMASVNSSATFAASAMDLIAPLRIKTIEPYDIDLVIGTIISTSVNWCWIVRWDTVQTTWQFARSVKENGINAFLWLGDTTLAVQAGTYGRWYLYDGQGLQPYKRMPGTWLPTKYGEVFPQAVGNLRGIPIFGFSNGSGNPCEQGIYSMGNYSKDYPRVLSGPEYVISEDVVASISIGAIIVDGQNVYVSWQNDTTFGIDKLDYSNKYASAYMETLRITPDIKNSSVTARIWVNYQSLPTGTGVVFSYKKNNDASYTEMTTITDTINCQQYAELSLDGRVFQFKIAFTVSTNDPPIIEAIGIELV